MHTTTRRGALATLAAAATTAVVAAPADAQRPVIDVYDKLRWRVDAIRYRLSFIPVGRRRSLVRRELEATLEVLADLLDALDPTTGEPR